MPLIVHTPAVAARQPRRPIAPRTTPLVGQVWGFVDTSKVNADVFIEALQGEIERTYRPKGFVVVRKVAPGFPLTPEERARLRSACGFVVFCFGD